LLARSQNALGQWQAAAKAYERAVALMPSDAQLLADYADVQVMVQAGDFAGKPMALTQQALKIDPKNMKALALAGTAEMRAGNKTQSIKHWEKLKALLLQDARQSVSLCFTSCSQEMFLGRHESPHPSDTSEHMRHHLFALCTYRT
jgi:cytochrome c-type biogenesis protein CcmH/NrfG